MDALIAALSSEEVVPIQELQIWPAAGGRVSLWLALQVKPHSEWSAMGGRMDGRPDTQNR